MDNNDLVIQTELALIKAQFPVKETEFYYQSSACEWSDQVKSHVTLLKPGAKSMPDFSPCEHTTFCVHPYQDESFGWIDEYSTKGFSNATMILKQLPNLSCLDQNFSLFSMQTTDSWDDYFQAKFLEKNPFKDKKLLANFIEFCTIRKGDFEGDWYLFKKGEQILGRIGVFVMNLAGKRVARLQDVEIVPNQQDKGYGLQLLLHILKLTRSFSPDAICLCCDDERGLPKFYAKVGFEQVGRWKIFPLPA